MYAKPSLSQPDILVLGDSQISFGAGKEYLSFFEQLTERCNITPQRQKALRKLGERKTAAIGVRSTSLQSWTTPRGAAKGAICDVDKKFGVNAGAYGINDNPKRVFVQIGKGDAYQFCKPNKTAFEAMFEQGYYKPNLLVLTFLGNSADRWAHSPELAAKDARATLAQVPRDVPCVFISSVPVYLEKTNDTRMRAQTEIARAFKKAGNQCAVVEGFNQQTRAAIEGQAVYFRRNDSGRVKDPHHPKPAAIRQFLEINSAQICSAVFKSLR
ncbi:SGNH/GDSL hydrolase family protein [Shimia sp. R10_1]|uniref:SGNH/GDSL hydrolase family protein n=1 Tax=Shimia sp. R10_1 TaxID=2821095 RepID=UPI001ADD07D1|nr:SGNH/GDSL hydrolase family protein [Shimia sp. R10_1]MBO9474832.1 SGNH/GDSL hydrolase family protein [Shimia sp. R10_1]